MKVAMPSSVPDDDSWSFGHMWSTSVSVKAASSRLRSWYPVALAGAAGAGLATAGGSWAWAICAGRGSACVRLAAPTTGSTAVATPALLRNARRSTGADGWSDMAFTPAFPLLGDVSRRSSFLEYGL